MVPIVRIYGRIIGAMEAILKLIAAENLKLYRRTSTLVMVAVFLAVILLATVFENRLNPFRAGYWTRVAGQAGLTFLITLFSIIVAGGIMANEFAWGTIKLVLIRPISRGKILFAKYLAVLSFILALLLILMASSMVLNGVFGLFAQRPLTPGPDFPNAKVIHYSAKDVLVLYLLRSIGVWVFAGIAFMLSVVARGTAVSTGFTFFALLFGPEIANMIGDKPWARYFLFRYTDLTKYVKIGQPVPGNDLWTALAVIGVYLLLFYGIAWSVFTKRDVLT